MENGVACNRAQVQLVTKTQNRQTGRQTLGMRWDDGCVVSALGNG